MKMIIIDDLVAFGLKCLAAETTAKHLGEIAGGFDL